MGKHSIIGEFEQVVLLAILRLDNRGYAIEIREEIEASTGRSVSRGALYRTLDRLEAKEWVVWEVDDSTPDRGGHPRRAFRVAAPGVEALRESRTTLLDLWAGLEAILER